MSAREEFNVTDADDIFVGQNVPFVGFIAPPETPFVCRNIPLDRNCVRGFTLVELMVTLAVVAILVMVAIPNMRVIILNNRLATQANDLKSDVVVAQSAKARKANAHVVMCTSSSATACTGGGWNSGRLIFLDDPPYNSALDPGEIVIRFHEPLTGSVEAGPGTNFPDPLVFNFANGNSPLNAMRQRIGPVQFVLCDTERRVNGRFLTLTPGGTFSVTQTQPCP